jgi:succinate dehydrogenase / fumarate reductase, cytochrome b subunit
MFQITALLSICHRITGVFLSMGLVFASLWVWAAAFSPACFAWFNSLTSSVVGQIALVGLSFCLFYHTLNGVRHLAWDAGRGFELKNVYRSGYAVVAGAVLLTVLFWGVLV